MRSLRRVLGAPGLLLALWLVDLASARLSSYNTRSMASGGGLIGPGAGVEPDRLLHATIELMFDNPALAGSFLPMAVSALATTLALDLALAGPTVQRLAGRQPPTELLAAAGRWLLPVACQQLWVTVVRGVAVGLFMLARELPNAFAVPTMVGLGLVALSTWPAVQLARARVILGDAAPYHVRTTWRSMIDSVRSPSYALASVGLLAAQFAISMAMFVYASANLLVDETIWLVRAGTLITTTAGVWMTALAVEKTTPRTPKPSASR